MLLAFDIISQVEVLHNLQETVLPLPHRYYLLHFVQPLHLQYLRYVVVFEIVKLQSPLSVDYVDKQVLYVEYFQNQFSEGLSDLVWLLGRHDLCNVGPDLLLNFLRINKSTSSASILSSRSLYLPLSFSILTSSSMTFYSLWINS